MLILKGYIVCDCSYITFLKWQNEEHISGCQELEMEEVEKGGEFGYKKAIQRILVVMTLFCIFTMVMITQIYR